MCCPILPRDTDPTIVCTKVRFQVDTLFSLRPAPEFVGLPIYSELDAQYEALSCHSPAVAKRKGKVLRQEPCKRLPLSILPADS